MLKSTHTHTYEKSVDDVGATYLDPDFLTAKFEHSGSRNITVAVEALDDNIFEVTVDREVPADVPGPLKSIVKPWNKMSTKEHWSGPDGGPYVGQIAITTEGVPAKISSVITISETDIGCETVTVTSVKCSVPIIGKTLEKFIAKEANKSLDDEAEYIE